MQREGRRKGAHADLLSSLAVPIIFSVLFGLANIWCFSGIL
jgi:hypothetical protein